LSVKSESSVWRCSPALLLDQLVERAAVALLVRVEHAVELVEQRAAAGAA
jgi:hypothetical protein